MSSYDPTMQAIAGILVTYYRNHPIEKKMNFRKAKADLTRRFDHVASFVVKTNHWTVSFITG